MSAESLWEELQKMSGDPSDLSRVRRLNDQLMQLERAFIVPEGLPGRPYYKLEMVIDRGGRAFRVQRKLRVWLYRKLKIVAHMLL